MNEFGAWLNDFSKKSASLVEDEEYSTIETEKENLKLEKEIESYKRIIRNQGKKLIELRKALRDSNE